MKSADRIPVSAAATGQVRQLCRQLAADADRIIRAAEGLPRPMIEAAMSRSSLASRRGLRHIAARIPAPLIHTSTRQAAWRFLCPLGDTIKVQAVLLGAANRPLISVESFGLNCCRHALGRLLDRTGFAADPVRAMLAAHDALMALHPDDGERLFALSHLPLPAAGGAFLAVRQPMQDSSPMLSCRTWIAADQTYPDQDRNLEVWQRFLANDAASDREYNGLQVKEVST